MPLNIVQFDPAEEPVPLLHWRGVAAALAIFWLAFIAMYTLRAALLGFDHQVEALLRRIAVAIVGMSLSWLMYRVLERLSKASMRTRIMLTVAMSLPAGLVFAIAYVFVFYVLAPIPETSCDGRFPCFPNEVIATISDLLISWTFAFIIWGMLYLSLASAVATRRADLQASAHREAARLSEIRALRYQINPHFLFNVLNSLMALVGRRQLGEAESLITQMASFMRYSLAADPLADVMLSDEIAMQVSYLELERRRFPTRMMVEVEVSEKAASALVPGLLLQPLVENAVKHGLSHSIDPVRIKIHAVDLPDGRLRICVEDDASPLAHQPPRPARAGAKDAGSFGLGLKNVAERLALHFDGTAKCSAGPVSPRGFRVELSLPLIRR
jgi:two-component system LytT family sensor kinase